MVGPSHPSLDAAIQPIVERELEERSLRILQTTWDKDGEDTRFGMSGITDLLLLLRTFGT